MTEIIIAVISSGIISTLISNIFVLINNRKKHNDGVSQGVRALLYDKIKFLGTQFISRGEIKSDDLESLIDMHRIYHDELGGNGYLDSIMSQVKTLKIKG